jgi:hypothetical protein
MSQRNITPHSKEDRRGGEAARARAELERAAEAGGVTPFTSLEEFAAPPELADGFDVDEFLRVVREDRDRQSGRSAG